MKTGRRKLTSRKGANAVMVDVMNVSGQIRNRLRYISIWVDPSDLNIRAGSNRLLAPDLVRMRMFDLRSFGVDQQHRAEA